MNTECTIDLIYAYSFQNKYKASSDGICTSIFLVLVARKLGVQREKGEEENLSGCRQSLTMRLAEGFNVILPSSLQQPLLLPCCSFPLALNANLSGRGELEGQHCCTEQSLLWYTSSFLCIRMHFLKRNRYERETCILLHHRNPRSNLWQTTVIANCRKVSLGGGSEVHVLCWPLLPKVRDAAAGQGAASCVVLIRGVNSVSRLQFSHIAFAVQKQRGNLSSPRCYKAE